MILLHFFGCVDLKSDPNVPLEEPEVALIHRMPLVLPLESINSDTYYNDSSAYYLNEYNRMALRRPLPEIQLSSGQGTYYFTEYAFTINSEEPQPVYAMTTGHLFHLHPGDLYAYAFTEAGSFIADEEMLVLVAVSDVPKYCSKYYYPKDVPVIRACIMRNISLSRDSLIDEIGANYTEEYFKLRGYQFNDPERWKEEYYEDWFLKYSTEPILVKGGSKIALTKPDQPSSSSPQRLSLFFEVGGWGNNEENARKFFFYRCRREKLEGHPMIALTTELPVDAGYVDYIHPAKDPYAGRGKDDLIEAAESGSDYDPIALDPEQDPTALVVQKRIPDNVTVPRWIHLPDNYGTTRIRVRNPRNLPIQITGYDPGEVTISPSSFSADNQIVTFEATQNSPSSPDNKIEIALNYLDPSTGESRTILPLTLVFYEFQMIPIKFHKLSDSVRSALITVDQLEQILDHANHILGRQTNVYIYPVEDEDGVILHDLIFNEDLGAPLEGGTAFNYGLDKIYQRLDQESTGDNCHHVFTWLAKSSDGNLITGGLSWKSSWNPLNYFIATLQATEIRLKDPIESYALQECAQILIHELGHWFTTRYISSISDFLCTSGTEHFEHSDCPGGDHGLYANMMAKFGSATNIKITLNQAEVYIQYAPQVKE